MKLQRPCILLFSMLLCFTSCKKDEENIDNVKPGEYRVRSLDIEFVGNIHPPKEAYNALSIKLNMIIRNCT